jgi:hypothetical protein
LRRGLANSLSKLASNCQGKVSMSCMGAQSGTLPKYSLRWEVCDLSRNKMPEKGSSELLHFLTGVFTGAVVGIYFKKSHT